VSLIGALFGLASSGAVGTLMWFGVAGVLHANATGIGCTSSGLRL